MLKKTVLFIIIVYLILIAFSNIYIKPYRHIGNEELKITKWNYALDEIEPNKIKISYSVILSNVSNGNILIKTLEPEYKAEILKDIEYEDVIDVRKEIIPNEELEISWDILINKNEMTIKEIKAFLKSIKVDARVEGENIINHNLEITFNQ